MNTRILLIILVIVLVALGVYAFARMNDEETVTVAEPKSFEECAARYPVMESNPRRCVTPRGAEFTETVVAPPEPVQPTTGIPNLISVDTPTRGQKITSPLIVTGSARGTWYFEASFPVSILDAQGRVIAQKYAEAQSDWMTENFVRFHGSIPFPAQPAGSTGTVVLHKDNPSGDPARDQSVSIPIIF